MNSAAARQGSPAPPSPKSGVTATAKRPRRAAGALSDITNLLPPPPAVATPTPTKPKRITRRTTLQQQKQQPQPAPSSDASSTCSSPACVTPAAAPKRSFAASLEAEGSAVKSPAISTVYARRGAATEAAGRRRKGALVTADKGKGKELVTADKGKGKELVTADRSKGKEPVTADKGKGKEPVTADTAMAADGPSIRPPLGKSTANRSRKTSVAQDTRPISASAPCHREAKKRRPSESTPKLPEDFVREKRAYFAEIDAFELPEEEVSESDLD